MTGRDAPSPVTRQLARFVAGSRWADIAEPVRKEALRSILNGFGAALGGSSDQATVRMLETLQPFSATPSASIVGHRTRVDMLTAAFLNAVVVNVFDFDDTHEGTIIHPTAPVAPAVFALAEGRPRITGEALLHAFVLGVEVECRLGNAVSPGHYRRGWHITSTCGVFGAAAAAGKLLGLDEERLVWALGNASAQSSGLIETLGTMAKSVGVGNSARNGIVAALLAANGVAGPEQPIEGPRGFMRVTCDAPDFGAVTQGLGEHWELMRNMYKPYPCGVVLNPVIDACLEIGRKPSFSAASVERVTVAGHPLLKERTDRPSPASGREAQVSAQHAVAVSLLRASAGVADFSDAAVGDPDVQRLRRLVQPIEIDPSLAVEAARVTVELHGGARLETTIEVASGSLEKPLSDDQLEAKVKALAAYGCPQVDPQALIDRIWNLPQATDAGSVMDAARPL
jgi:2-methylcitrate dehydratase PrpD